ncbi:MAG: PaaI family thioesterase [Rhizobiales bacterium]|nr:PaaI family thioesterase [Hyphomicrobiales bacterium]
MNAMHERIETSFMRQGMMQALGCELVSVAQGKVEFALPLSDKVTQQQGTFHGGALGALADISCGYAALTVAPDGMEVTSVEYKINFTSAAVGERVHCIGEVKKAGRTLAVCQAELFDVKNGERKSCGFMQATMIYIEKRY